MLEESLDAEPSTPRPSGTPKLVASGAAVNGRPAWTVDGSHLVFWYRTDGDVAVVPTEGGEPRPIGLVEAAGSEVVGEPIFQRRQRQDAATLLGKGKVAEVKEAIDEFEPDAIVVDNDLSPGQLRNLEKAWGRRVLDRSEVILDIFARRARTRQAKLQVELAQAEYLLPRLRRMWTHLERTEGAIGTRGPGETQLETDRRLLRRRTLELRRELDAIEARRNAG